MRLEQQISEVRVSQRLVLDADAESQEKIEMAKSFLDKKEMDEEMWEKFVEDVIVYPDYRMEIKWSFEE